MLLSERKALNDEIAAQKARPPVPVELRYALNENAVKLVERQTVLDGIPAEIVRVTASYDAQLPHLLKLWSTAPSASQSESRKLAGT